MGDEHLWRVQDRSFGNYSGVRRVIPIMGADYRPCSRDAPLNVDARLGLIKDLTLWP